MDYFENIILKIIGNDNKWVRQNVKIDLTKEEKRKIGKLTMPRPDIDIVAYQPLKNIIEIWEVKSFLDSQGVRFRDLNLKQAVPKGSYKILTSQNYREVVIKRLIKDWTKQGLILPKPKVKIGLAAGKIYSNDEAQIKKYFSKKGWLILTPSDIQKRLRDLANLQYENDPYTIASKIIFRND